MTEEKIWDEINAGWTRMSPRQQKLWNTIRIDPEKWAQHPWGDEGGGFWVVALIGRSVIWHNDIEEGFNLSRWSRYGEIDEYWCNQDELELTVQHILDMIDTGEDKGLYLGPPEPCPFPV